MQALEAHRGGSRTEAADQLDKVTTTMRMIANVKTLPHEPSAIAAVETDSQRRCERALDMLLTQVEKKSGLPVGHIGIEAQIETARGLINVDEICAASPRLETIIFGPADFAASIEMPVLTGGVAIPEYPGDHFHYVFSRILMAGRANGLQVIDGPFLKVRELDALRHYAQRTRMLGYDGKWALTPDQAALLNEVYSPTQEQFDHAYDILAAYRKATDEDRKGAVMFGDEMIDEASRKMALKFVSRGERAGLTRSPD